MFLSFWFRNVVPLGQGIEKSKTDDKVEEYHKVSFYCYVKPLNLLNGSLCRGMSTTRGRSMRSKVERRMQKESGKTIREIRRAKKITKKLMTDEERLVYNLKRVSYLALFYEYTFCNSCFSSPYIALRCCNGSDICLLKHFRASVLILTSGPLIKKMPNFKYNTLNTINLDIRKFKLVMKNLFHKKLIHETKVMKMII